MEDLQIRDHYLMVLEHQKQRNAAVRALKGQRPQGRVSLAVLEARFKKEVQEWEKQDGQRNEINGFQTIFVVSAYAPCRLPFDKLRKIMIDELVFKTRHRGRYLLLRTTTGAARTSPLTPVCAIAQDENDDGIMLQLYNRPGAEKRAASDILPQSTFLIVKDPYLVVTNDGGHSVRVDHQTDVVVLSPTDTRIPTEWIIPGRFPPPEELTDDGHRLMVEGKFYEAAECFTKALELWLTAEETALLFFSRSMVFLHIERFGAVVRDIQQFHWFSSFSMSQILYSEALLVEVEAYYGQQLFEKCCAVMAPYCDVTPGHTEAKALLLRCSARLQEQRNGTYHYQQMHRDAASLRPPLLDYADYIGPIVMKHMGERGQRMFTTRPVEAGDLLLCLKAEAFHYNDPECKTGAEKQGVLIDTKNNRVGMDGEAELVQLMIGKMMNQPSRLPFLKQVYSVQSDVVEVDGHVVFDTFVAHSIVASSILRVSNGSLLQDMIKKSHIGKGLSRRDEPESKTHPSSGVWTWASPIKHSCMSNCNRAHIGDMMIIRAARDMPARTELTMCYHAPKSDRNIPESWGLRCECSMCKDIRMIRKRNEEVLSQRSAYRHQALRQLKKRTTPATMRAEDIATALANTYQKPAAEVPRVDMVDILLGLSFAYPFMQPTTIDKLVDCIECMGFVVEGARLPYNKKKPLVIKRWGSVVEEVVFAWLLLVKEYRKLGHDRLAWQARTYARNIYKICVGEHETFEETLYAVKTAYDLAALRRDI